MGTSTSFLGFTSTHQSFSISLGTFHNKPAVCPNFPASVQATIDRPKSENEASDNLSRENKGEPQKKPQTRRRASSKRPSTFEATIDNMTMKRMGRGTIYYGEKPVFEEEEVGDDEETLKPDPVLVTGATGRTGQWITLGLLNQEFNVRCLSRKFGRAESLFGPSGSNVDVFEADITKQNDVQPAVDGAVAIICASGGSRWVPGALDGVDVTGVANLIAAAKDAGSVRRFVLISTSDETSPRARAKRKAEHLLIKSGLPYVIIRIAKLSDGEGGVMQIATYPIIANSNDQTASRAIARVDLAQCVCQALVHDRKMTNLRKENPDEDFVFPNCIFSAENINEPYIPDKRFWPNTFNQIGDAFRPKSSDTNDEQALASSP